MKQDYMIAVQIAGQTFRAWNPYAEEADKFGRALAKQISQRPPGWGVEGVLVYDPNRQRERFKRGVEIMP